MSKKVSRWWPEYRFQHKLIWKEVKEYGGKCKRALCSKAELELNINMFQLKRNIFLLYNKKVKLLALVKQNTHSSALMGRLSLAANWFQLGETKL